MMNAVNLFFLNIPVPFIVVGMYQYIFFTNIFFISVALCRGFCALQCPKNSVVSGGQSHGCLYMFRMFNRMKENVRALCWDIVFLQPTAAAKFIN